MNNPYTTRTTVNPAALAAYTSTVLLARHAYRADTHARCHSCAATAEPNRSRCDECAERERANLNRKAA